MLPPDSFIYRSAPNAPGFPVDTSPDRVRHLVEKIQQATRIDRSAKGRATKAHVAAMLGVSLNQLNNWMRGKVRGRSVGADRDRRAPYCVVYCLEALAFSPAATFRAFWTDYKAINTAANPQGATDERA